MRESLRDALRSVPFILKLALLSAVLRVTEPVSGLIDLGFSGFLGENAQAAVGLGATMMTAAAWLTGPLLFGHTTVVSELHDTGRSERLRSVIRSALSFSLKVGLILCAVILLLSASTILPADTSLYLMIRAFAIPFTAISMAMWGGFRGVDKTWVAAVIALSAAVFQAVLAALMVGSIGVIGLGLAGVIAQIASASISVGVAHRLGLLGGAAGPNDRSSRRAQVLLMVRSSALGASTMLMAWSASSTGSVPGAAYQLTYQVWIIAIMVADGWRAAGQVILARGSLARKHGLSARALVWVSVLFGALLALVFTGVLPIADGGLAGSPAIGAAAAQQWPWAALAVWCAALTFALDGIDYGRGHFAKNLWRTLMGTVFWVIGAVVAYLTGTVIALWFGIAAGFALRIVVSLVTRP